MRIGPEEVYVVKTCRRSPMKVVGSMPRHPEMHIVICQGLPLVGEAAATKYGWPLRSKGCNRNSPIYLSDLVAALNPPTALTTPQTPPPIDRV